jgi:NADH-quinone oxidoreductase subunit I
MAHAPAKPKTNKEDGEVIGVTGKLENVRTVKVYRPEPEDTSFLSATLKGLGVTLRHFFRNVATKTDVETIRYPEERKPYPERNRGLHRLMHREDGAVRCVACMMCPTVCPAHCITIVPAETDDKGVEKYPASFEIDELRCVVCGLCVEACPCDAIRMDTGLHAPPVEQRSSAIMTKEMMLSLGTKSIATQGGMGQAWRDAQPDPQYEPVSPYPAPSDEKKKMRKKK